MNLNICNDNLEISELWSCNKLHLQKQSLHVKGKRFLVTNTFLCYILTLNIFAFDLKLLINEALWFILRLAIWEIESGRINLSKELVCSKYILALSVTCWKKLGWSFTAMNSRFAFLHKERAFKEKNNPKTRAYPEHNYSYLNWRRYSRF